MEEDLSERSSGNLVNTDEQLKEQQRGINSDGEDNASIRRKLAEYIDPLDPSNHPPSLVNTVNVTIAPTYAYLDQA
ncbi:hypothetical protein DPMN_009190 [Dreissena polymorpha]|uniref:Uncharacterized protein n=1 Tax=Dreissena polymorpha TaxID=45954 RepID=A0A9D4MWK2_DREPO|nr:hypothetical protein DPMN_009190 [Dreissena polymorpha]